MFSSLVRYFYPHIKQEEIKKFGLLSVSFFLIIGAYWLLRLLKDTIFLKVAFPENLGWIANQGRHFQPTAKTLSVFVVLVTVLIYSKLVDIFKKHQLFYVICGFYATLFALVGGLIFIKDFYGAEVLGKHILGTMGWVSYFAIESFGSLVVALFWSFTNSITDSDAAKRGFPLIVACAQVGAIAGSSLMFFTESFGSLWPLLMLASIFIGIVILAIRHFMAVIPAHQLVGNKAAAATEKKSEGFFEGFISGLVLLLTRPYMLGILIVSTFYEIAGQILDFQMKAQADAYPGLVGEAGFAKFMGYFGVGTNVLSFLTALLGTSYLMQKFGIRFCLLVYPVSFALALGGLFLFFLYGNPTAGELLWATFAVMMVVKGVSYAVNNPTKEMMYIPTSKDAKFKSKGWIDMFGGRGSKALGAQVTGRFTHDLPMLMMYGTMASFGLIGIWVIAAVYVGIRNQQLIKNNEIVE